jgi:hypothetical protein
LERTRKLTVNAASSYSVVARWAPGMSSGFRVDDR